jgi:GNAT superfamily N-acetyltransferase
MTNIYNTKPIFNKMKEIIKQRLLEMSENKLDTSKIKIKKAVVNNLLVYTPFYDGSRMGAFRLRPTDDGYKIFGTVLYDDYRGKGFGKGMYRYIIKDLSKDGKILYSDDKQSEDAARVWDSLVSMGIAEKTGSTYKSKI